MLLVIFIFKICIMYLLCASYKTFICIKNLKPLRSLKIMICQNKSQDIHTLGHWVATKDEVDDG